MTRTVLVTGGAGFIGSAVVRRLTADSTTHVVNVDKLTYAANPATVDALAAPNHAFVHADVCDSPAMVRLLGTHRPDAVIHLAAETHVDRRLTVRPLSSRPMSSAPRPCSKRCAPTGPTCPRRRVPPSASCKCRRTRCSARWGRTAHSTPQAPTVRAGPMPHRRPRATTSRAPGTPPTACQRW